MVRQLVVSLFCAVGAVALPASTASTVMADFSLFAYGKGLGGHRVVEKDGFAYIVTLPFPTNCNNVTFSSGGTDRTLEARVGGNGTSTLFAVPTTAGALTFARDASNASVQTTGFGLYDSFLFVNTPGSSMAMDWFARPVADAANDIWELGWKLETDDAVPVALRSMAPSKPASRKEQRDRIGSGAW